MWKTYFYPPPPNHWSLLSTEVDFTLPRHLPENERLCMDIIMDDMELSHRPQAIDVFNVRSYTCCALSASTKHTGGSTDLRKPAQAVLVILASLIARHLGKNGSCEYFRLLMMLCYLFLQIIAHVACRFSLTWSLPTQVHGYPIKKLIFSCTHRMKMFFFSHQMIFVSTYLPLIAQKW